MWVPLDIKCINGTDNLTTLVDLPSVYLLFGNLCNLFIPWYVMFWLNSILAKLYYIIIFGAIDEFLESFGVIDENRGLWHRGLSFK